MIKELGLLAPLPTPWTDDTYSVSEVRLVRWVRRLLEAGARGLIVGTATGEAMFAAPFERKTVLEIVMRETQNMVPVLVDAQAPSTMASLDLAQHAHRHGARALILGPMRLRVTDEELFTFFRTVVAYSELPAIVVDPDHRIGEELGERLRQIAFLAWPEPIAGPGAVRDGTWRDSWTFDGTSTTPTAALAPALAPDTPALADLASAMRELEPARVIKLAAQMMDADLGPPRGPWLMLPDVVRGRIAAALRTAGLLV